LRVGVVDIGTNSMRLLVRDDRRDLGRWVEVTSLGKGVDATGRLSDDAIERTIAAFDGFGRTMDELGVQRRRAVATSATRDAANRDAFLDRAEQSLGVRPDVIGGDAEGRLAYAGATSDLDPEVDYTVSDIGGGSTEFVTDSAVTSIDIGSVRLTDRLLPDRPATPGQMEDAREHVRSLFTGMTLDGELVGVAGTWTSLAAMTLGLDQYDAGRVHHSRVTTDSIDELVGRLARLTVTETAAIPSLHPARAPVILAGGVVARGVMEVLRVDSALISEKDSLDGLATELLAVT
jgi:exopolyphosphatase/guanosine-5'-triphosphate,3'-diphosphate pyrophosphatase